MLSILLKATSVKVLLFITHFKLAVDITDQINGFFSCSPCERLRVSMEEHVYNLTTPKLKDTSGEYSIA